MTKPLNEHRKNIKPEVRATARAKAAVIIAEMSLAEGKKARGRSQPALAEDLKIAQPDVSCK